jgi:hypothetical protein
VLNPDQVCQKERLVKVCSSLDIINRGGMFVLNMIGLSPDIVCVGGTRGEINGTRGDLVVVVLKVNLVIDFGYSLALAKLNKRLI